MKINWGTGIVIAFGLFMTFILFFVFKVQTDNKYDNELYVEEYYKEELAYQEVIDGTNKANQLSAAVSIQQVEDQLIIQFKPPPCGGFFIM